ncbi:benzoate 4-monooxygenase cytochrome P450 [Xylaria palmicola]|nr:benzoate 4-monooxygenase cytochrome P450 [Xylaria palmicola]
MDSFDNILIVTKYAVLLAIPYYFLVCLYRLWLHPLRSYPGPVLAKISDVYSGFYSLKRSLHLQTFEDQQKYGPVIRHGPNKLIFNSTAALRAYSPLVMLDIYLNEDISKSFCYQAGNVNPTTTNVFNTIDKRVHRLKRKLVGQITTERSVRAFEPILSEQVDIFVKQLALSYQADPAAPIDLSERSRYLGLDISGYLGFGYALNLQTSHTHRYLVHAMMIGSWRLNMYMQFPALRKLRLEILFYALALIQGKSFLKTLSKMIQARLAKDKKAEHDLYSFMVDALEAPAKVRITASEIWTEGIFFLPAAGDTTSTALSSLFFYLARNPKRQEKAANEVRSAFKTSAEIGGSRLSTCPYLRACINEALRMSPPVAGTLWRERLTVNSGEPLVIDGHLIPPGTQVGVNTYTLHHNPEYFPDPFTYNPSRWFLEGDKATAGEESQPLFLIHHTAFTPFSLGSRGCAGKAMAYAEYFDFEFPPTSQKPQAHRSEFELRDIFTSTHDGPHLVFRPRGEFWRALVD